MNLKLNGKKLLQTNSVKYLGIKIDKLLNWREHTNEVAIKLNRANAMLYKVREFSINCDTLGIRGGNDFCVINQAGGGNC